MKSRNVDNLQRAKTHIDVYLNTKSTSDTPFKIWMHRTIHSLIDAAVQTDWVDKPSVSLVAVFNDREAIYCAYAQALLDRYHPNATTVALTQEDLDACPIDAEFNKEALHLASHLKRVGLVDSTLTSLHGWLSYPLSYQDRMHASLLPILAQIDEQMFSTMVA